MLDESKIKSISPIIFFAWLLSGYFYLYFYYSSFGVEIHNFFSIEDYLRARIGEIVSLLINIVIMFVFYYIDSKEREQSHGKRLVPSDKFIDILFWVNIIFYLIAFICVKYFIKPPDRNLELITLWLLLIFSYVKIIIKIGKTNWFRNVTHSIPILLLISIFFFIPSLLLNIYFTAKIESELVINGNELRKILVELNDGTKFESYLIGVNSNYYFFYDRSLNMVNIIPTGRTKNISFSKNKYILKEPTGPNKPSKPALMKEGSS